MIIKSAIAAHVALLKKQAAIMTDSAQAATEDPNKEVLERAKQEAARKKTLADVAVERSNADLATKKAASTIQQNQAKAQEIEAAQAETMPLEQQAQPGAPVTPGMPQPPQPAQTMTAGSWGMQPYQPTAQAGR